MTFVWWLTTAIIAVMFLGLGREAISAYKARTETLEKRNLYARAAHLLGPDLAKSLGYTDSTEEEDDD